MYLHTRSCEIDLFVLKQWLAISIGIWCLLKLLFSVGSFRIYGPEEFPHVSFIRLGIVDYSIINRTFTWNRVAITSTTNVANILTIKKKQKKHQIQLPKLWNACVQCHGLPLKDSVFRRHQISRPKNRHFFLVHELSTDF